MSAFTVKPNFNQVRNQMTFPTDSLNWFLREEIQDTFGFYQQQFGVYAYMQLTKKMKFRLYTMKGNPLVWQTHKSCGWDPTGSLKVGIQELEPSAVKINEEFCYDELFDSCFEHFLTWSGKGPIKLDANGIDMVNNLVQTLVENATIGARATLTAGQLYDPATVTFNELAPNNIQQLFTKTVGSVRGWVEMLRSLGTVAKYSHLDVPGIFSASDFSGDEFIGDVIGVYDALFAKAAPELQSFINEGGLAGIPGSNNSLPIMPVDVNFYNAVAKAWKTQCLEVTCTNPRLTREEFPITTARGPRKISVYYIDNTPVIPIKEINCYDTYLTGRTRFAGITLSGNLQLGASFDALPTVPGGNVSIMIEQSDRAKDLGKYYFLSHALMATTIANTDLMVATQEFTEPAAKSI